MQIQYKPSRKSGGRAWKEVSGEISNLLEMLNLFYSFIQTQPMAELKQPGFKEYLGFMGLKDCDDLPGGDFIRQRVDRFINSSHLDKDFIVFKMRWLGEVVCLMPERLALDIINQCPAYKIAGAESLLSFMKSHGFNMFGSTFIEDEEDEMTQSAEQNFLYCMTRYEELSLTSSLLRVIIPQWQQWKNNLTKKTQSDKPEILFFPAFTFPAEVNSYLKVGLTSDFKLQLYLNTPFATLSKTDFDRIRICPQCDKFFWAGRRDMSGCGQCGVSIRRKKWRDKRDNYVSAFKKPVK